MNLKHIRIAVSSVVLLAFLSLFCTWLPFLTAFAHSLLHLQFVPSVIHAVIGVSSMGFLMVLLATVLFGRVYCSVLCPLGILLDVVICISRKMGASMPYRRIPSLPRVRLMILVLTVFMAISGSLALVCVLDPFSIFGRAVTHIFISAGIGVNNALALLMTQLDHHMMTLKMPSVIERTAMILTGFLFLAAVASAFFFSAGPIATSSARWEPCWDT